ncbi:hypothetical protein DCE79_06685 [Lysinibacillus sp. 2017]|uniref:3D domain-containing protein n=1 Tax=unclassified Lysinibacillus TaxID=2636778 RepID=UPI000D528C54|nr:MULTISPECIES: 3D domain-containing protein [unclassified Lysinibacillus]AWE07109.1 hypothetical protein DCE79_06685 [Lysinibacillus sp. 2017]TGN36972.1 LysM peptidoglycan-binding domain-containing protein [Lysinibacillus sp. S2017]
MIKKLLSLTAVVIMSSLIFANTSFAATTYTVKSGDTLTKISKNYNTTVKAIMSANNLKSSQIKVKQVLSIPSKGQTSTAKKQTVSATDPSNVKKTIKMSATAFTATCKGCTGYTKIGINLRKNPTVKLIAVDPKIIPLGSKVWVEGYGIAIAGDTGGSIKGNKIDVFLSNKATANKWGRKTVTVKVLKS